jgi:hypothetical protein
MQGWQLAARELKRATAMPENQPREGRQDAKTLPGLCNIVLSRNKTQRPLIGIRAGRIEIRTFASEQLTE